MIQNKTAAAVCLLGLLAPRAFGFSSDGSALTRSFDQTTSLTNRPIIVTVTFTNAGSNALRGFFYTDHVPSGIAVSTLGLKLNGAPVYDYTFETDQSGSVYAGCAPHRWMLESPANFPEANPIPAHGTLQITYAVTSPLPGVFPFRQFSWAGYRPAIPDASFGHAENGDQQSLKFTNRLFAPLAVHLTGRGTVSPNYNGQLLEIGKRYTMTATPAAGFRFADWTGSLTTNRAMLSFLMQSNLAFTANFTDIARPACLITNPPANARLTEPFVQVKGWARDNVGVAGVFYQLNDGDWTNAGTANHWTNWTATLAMPAGTNVVRAYAQDQAGNRSPTNSRSYRCVVIQPATLQIVGKGKVVGLTNGQPLELGRTYQFNVSVAPGFLLTNWTVQADGATLHSTNRPPIRFAMASNLVLNVTFADVRKPVTIITNPRTGARLMTETATVRGKVTDNGWVQEVACRLNGGDWSLASGTTNWETDLNLQPGTNWFEVCAIDREGLRSATNRAAYFRVVTNLMTTARTGKGIISPDYNGKWLEIGRRYRMTATPAAGFLFTNWTDDADQLITNKPVVSFMMTSNLLLRANFVDVRKPVLTIASPLKGVRLMTETATVRGKVTDNGWVQEVACRLNDGDWSLASGTTNWETDLNLQPGTNWFEAFATDQQGLRSATNRAAYFRVVTNLITVTRQGPGTITPDYNGKWLEIGRPYRMTATPAPRHLFALWSGDVESTSPVLTFLMQSNLTLQANFVTNPFVGLKGTYYGLFAATNELRNHDQSGAFTLTLTEAGNYTANFRFGAALLRTAGKFDWLGQSWLNLKPSAATQVTVALQLDVTNLTAWLQGGVGNEAWSAPLAGYRAPLYPGTNTAPQIGRYTLVIPGGEHAQACPGGSGYATLTVSKAGWLTLAGRFADATAFSQSIPVSTDGFWALYTSLYTGKGSSLAWMLFTNREVGDINGILSWIKPALPASRYYPLGFTNEYEALGSRYLAPGTTNRVLNITNGLAVFSGGNLLQAFTNNILLTANNKVTNLSSNQLTMNLTLASGLFNGGVSDPDTGKAVLFNGALLQKLNAGYGCFLHTNRSGQVILEPVPSD